jgi:holo-[acyl-carrier protein] synthase
LLVGHGIDIVQVSRIESVYSKYLDQFVDRILTRDERLKYDRLNSKQQIIYLATRFAAKEAFAKALGVGIGQIAFIDIGIINRPNGKPEIKLSHRVAAIISGLLGRQEMKFHVSLTNTGENAMASVIIELVKDH